ncbi:helicase [Rugosibacter aromaticivorans]|uniref:DNA 5'-3' helicase n=1 Tax=Rugosibacter aromaticivorans TaxID=1565605 RepID=A0A0C5J029_9PROT|nr:ATP-dependent DNA helicase [Rugosibacter aromaticivorans]AJP48417.1 helicase [Rugosibacter aromaticivorans]TBR14797.1 MAG: ATP-dependent DNA helicase [Rugosibacter sp.]
MSVLDPIFAIEGPLAQAVEGFRVRPQQLEMAQRIALAIAGNAVLVAEAGTGTGKTFAYLVPALLSGGKVIISTGTKTLQDQLFNRDLPVVRAALKVGASIALLKGRSNYVCPYHLERALSAGRLASREEAGHLRKIVRFAERTKTGDKAECVDVPEDSAAWQVATSTRENCLGQECPNVKQCFVLTARQNAQMADVVVVNHHLFFADVMLKDEGMGELLPACNTVIFDEAHQLPEIAGLFFGESISTSQLIDLSRDARNEGITSAKDYLPLQEAAQYLDKAARDLRLSVKGENVRLPASQVENERDFSSALQTVTTALRELGKHLEAQSDRGEGLANCLERTQQLVHRLTRWQKGEAAEADGLVGPVVKWLEVYSHALSLNVTPLDIAPIFRRQMEGHPRAWIFASATLAVGQNFSHYCDALGLHEAETVVWGSPFDYANNGLLYAPLGMPDPNSAFYQEAVAEAAWPAIRAAGGRTFVLCTSLRAMRRIRELLQEKLQKEALDLPLLMQGEGSKTELLERFRFLGNAILVASQSFWEGVDVRGEALSLVVIDKLPFAPPDDPVLAARIESLRVAGENAFMTYQLPQAVISMKQGAGRLIRDEADRGVLMICDPRLTGKPYGKAIWRSLPPMRRTRDIIDVEAFFAQPVKSAP